MNKPIKIDKITLAGFDFPVRTIEMMPDDMLILINTNSRSKEKNVVVITGIDIAKAEEARKEAASEFCPVCSAALSAKKAGKEMRLKCVDPICPSHTSEGEAR